MEKTYEKMYEKVIEYVEDKIMNGEYQIGDKLPSERELSQMLSVSRNSVREGLRILGVIGVIDSQQGLGNYITDHFDKILVQVMTMMYALEKMTYDEIREFRYAVEFQALVLAMSHISETQIKLLDEYLYTLENSKFEEKRIFSDKMIHYTIVEASGNRLIISNYLALTRVMDGFIRDMRNRISKDTEGSKDFQEIHRQLVEAIKKHDIELGKSALDKHFIYLCQDVNT